MRSRSPKNSVLAQVQVINSPCTPYYSNQHWLSTFRQGIDGIDELDREEEEITADTDCIEAEQMSSQDLPAAPTSSSPLPTMSNSDFSVNMAMAPSSSSTSLCSSLCYSDALDSPMDAGDVDIVFLAQLQDRLAIVARGRERQHLKRGNDSVEVASSTSARYPNFSDLSNLAMSVLPGGNLVPGVSDGERDLQSASSVRLATKKRTRSISSHSLKDEWQYSLLPPESKRPRLSRYSGSTDTSRSRKSRNSSDVNINKKENDGFAYTTATMRRALSLRSHDTLNDVSSDKMVEHSERIEKKTVPIDWVPTVPCSPSPAKPARRLPPPRELPQARASVITNADSDTDTDTDIEFKEEPQRQHTKPAALEPVPIIAPPSDCTPSLPLSTEKLAKKRIERFREREMGSRVADDLPVVNMDREKMLTWKSFGVDQDFGEKMVKWILQVLPFQSPSPRPSLSSTSSSSSTISSSESSTSVSPFMCPSPQTSWSSSSLESLVPPRESKTPYQKGIDNLIHQLRTTPETRFMGVYMLMRFFWRLSTKPESNRHLLQAEIGQKDDALQGKDKQLKNHNVLAEALGVDEERFTQSMWDIVVGCLALSVKMYRDFLPPLFPVYSQVFEDIAPHAQLTRGEGMDYDQFEGAQRLILFALKYNLGGSPQAVLYELWESGILRDVLVYAGCGPVCKDEREVLRWWGALQRETWNILFKVVVDPRVLLYPLSALTGCAVLLGLERVLVFERYPLEVEWWCELEFRRERQQRKDEMGKEERRRRRQAKTECEGVAEDIKELLGIGDTVYRECRTWLKQLLCTE